MFIGQFWLAHRTSLVWLFGRRRRLRRWRWHDEFRVVYRNVLFQFVHLNGKAVAGAGDSPAERSFDAVGRAVISVIDLGGIVAERRVNVANQADQQIGLFVEIELERRLAFILPYSQPSVVAIDFFSGQRS